MKNKIIEYGKKLEIDLIGFAKAEKFYELEKILLNRKSKNYLSGLEEKDIQKQIDPKLVLDDAKSIIVVGISYNNSIDKKKKSYDKIDYRGDISKSSWGKDYHIVLKEKMSKLVELIDEDIEEFRYKFFVDTGPLVDRYLAYKSGIGWYGKNNCIMNDEYGSWIFIGYIICNLEIEPNVPYERKCMECRKCIDLCPTKALKDNYDYNAKKCISYLTVTKEDIDYSLREKMKNSIYGCDICQKGCPHNKNAHSIKNNDFKIKDHYSEIDLLELLDMSKKQFKERFGNSALAWRGHNIIKRNAIIALGNSQKPEVVEELKKHLSHSSAMIRKYTAWAIIKIDSKRGKDILEKHLDMERDKDVIKEIEKLIAFYSTN